MFQSLFSRCVFNRTVSLVHSLIKRIFGGLRRSDAGFAADGNSTLVPRQREKNAPAAAASPREKSKLDCCNGGAAVRRPVPRWRHSQQATRQELPACVADSRVGGTGKTWGGGGGRHWPTTSSRPDRGRTLIYPPPWRSKGIITMNINFESACRSQFHHKFAEGNFDTGCRKYLCLSKICVPI